MIFSVTKLGSDLRVTFSGPIGASFWEDGLTYEALRDAIEPERSSVKSVTLEICSPGGDVLEAFAIYNYLNSLGIPITAEVTGWAASAASYIIMAADNIKVHSNSFILIHEPSVCECGDRSDHRKAAAVLDSIYKSLVDAYMTHAAVPRNQIEDLVTAETWLTAEDAKNIGLADEILSAIPAAAAAQFPIDSEKFHNIPTSMKGLFPMPKKNIKKVRNEEPVKCPDCPDCSESEEPVTPETEPVTPDSSESGEVCPDCSESLACEKGTAEGENQQITDLACQITNLVDQIEDLKGALKAAKDSEADAKRQLSDLRAQIDRLTAGVKSAKHTEAKPEDDKDWETLMSEGDGSPSHYMNMRKRHPEAFKAYLAKFNQ